MMEILCQCDRYPEAHSHAIPTTMGDDGQWHSHLRRMDGSWAEPGDVVRRIDWRAEGGRIAVADR